MESINISIIRKHLFLRFVNLFFGIITVIISLASFFILNANSSKGEPENAADLFSVAVLVIIIIPSLIITALVNIFSTLFLAKIERKNLLNTKAWEKISRYIFVAMPFVLVFWFFFRSIL